MEKRAGHRGKGRVKGVPNKATADIKALARVHGPAIVVELARLALSAESEAARVAAGKELLDRAYGKATVTANINVKRDVRNLTDEDLLHIASGGGAGTAAATGGEDEHGTLH